MDKWEEAFGDFATATPRRAAGHGLLQAAAPGTLVKAQRIPNQ